MDIFVDLSREDRSRLIESVFYAHIPEGTEFIKQGAPAEACYFLLTGEIAIKSDDAVLQLQEAPTVIGLLSVIDRQERSASVVTFADCDVVMMPAAAFDKLMERSTVFAHNVIRHLTGQVRDLHRADVAARSHFDDHFESPNARLLQGPYTFEGSVMYAFVMQSDPANIASLCPPGIRPMPGTNGRYLLTFNRFPKVESLHPSGEGRVFSYSECTPFVPCLGPGGRPAVFSPELYLDNYMGIALGREMYGFPKRYGRVDIRETWVGLSVDNKVRARAAWREQRPIEASELIVGLVSQMFDAALAAKLEPVVRKMWAAANRPGLRRMWPAVPVILHNQVPDAFERSGNQMRIDEVVEVPFCLRAVRNFQKLEDVTMRTFETWIPGGEAIDGYCLTIDMTFGRARRPRDYQNSPNKPGEFVNHALSPWLNSISDLFTTY
jgi:CRP-like cAMP-binding protein